LQEWHQRWFAEQAPPRGVEVENLSEGWLGFSLSGPRSREILAQLTHADVSNAGLPFLGCRTLDLAHGIGPAIVCRVSLTGELGYEINVPAARQRQLWDALIGVGTPRGLRPIGMKAQDSLRLEKGYGVWSLEFTTEYTPAETGLSRYVAPDKGEFVGRRAFLDARGTRPSKRLVLLAVDSPDADVTGFEPVRREDGRRVGYVTSGAYGHHVRSSLALGYVDTEFAQGTGPLTVSVVGVQRPARILAAPPYDPAGARLRG
jgi:dimethylglycine dehydrogenase